MIKPGKDKKSNYLWDIFSSVNLTIILLIILAIASVFGTLIPQEEGAYDMYHSFWFRIIILLLALNLIVCSINRLPATLRLFRRVPRPDRSKPFENLPLQRSFLAEGEIEEISDRVTELLKVPYKNVLAKKTSNGNFFYGEKGRYSHFGVYLVHLSILIILIGGIVGSLFGFEAFVNIREGDTVDTVTLRKGMASIKLGFEVRLDKFTVDFYENQTPKEFRSDLRFLARGIVLEKGSLLVNHPITFRGITFYQSSYGTTPGKKVRLTISKEASGYEDSTLEVELGRPITLPGKRAKFMVGDIRADFMRLGPAALILIRPPDEDETRFWVFQNHERIRRRFPGMFEKFPRLNPAIYKPYTFYLDSIESKFYTGLQVNKDPGVILVWLGFFMLVTGFITTFFQSHRKILVRVSENKGKIRVSVAGRANKNPVGLERELDQFTYKLRNLLTA